MSHRDEALPIEKILKQQPTHTVELKEIYEAIDIGAMSFLRAAYSVCAIFVVFFSILIFSAIAWSQNMSQGFLTTLCFILGAVTSIVSCYIGMKVAVFSNVRTTINAKKDGYEHCFNTAFRAGAVMGFALTGADVGADLVGKVVHGIPEDDRRNPATIADNGESIFISAPASPCLTSPPAVGDNVGVVGMGADLFGSFAESLVLFL
jgi:H+-translocating diphosphatase